MAVMYANDTPVRIDHKVAHVGIELDEDMLARYGEKFFDITTKGIAVKTIREKGFFTALKLARKKRKKS